MNENLEPRVTRLETRHDTLSKLAYNELTEIRVHLAENSKDLVHQNDILKNQQKTLEILTKEVSIHIRRTEILEKGFEAVETRQETLHTKILKEIQKFNSTKEEKKWARFQYWLHRITYVSMVGGMLLTMAKVFGLL